MSNLVTPITLPESTTATISGHIVTVKGPKGELKYTLHPLIKVRQEDNQLVVERQAESKFSRALHGLHRSLLSNAITGVTEGFQKRLELVGTGYRVAKAGDNLSLQLGFSHPIEVKPRLGITFITEGQNKIVVQGADKQLVGQAAADIRALRKPEPYKGKGIRYEGEVVRRKAGKAAKVGTAA